ncbi:hypothetical protein DID80_05935 [Candidatus Marinamargulisbacteria bacterium SCGC AAA071-K20]|nr:hypothetical protein DID80_05935 [Candidatus Marinamargulisbacteria bacterium SCGC AAA071-K20]
MFSVFLYTLCCLLTLAIIFFKGFSVLFSFLSLLSFFYLLLFSIYSLFKNRLVSLFFSILFLLALSWLPSSITALILCIALVFIIITILKKKTEFTQFLSNTRQYLNKISLLNKFVILGGLVPILFMGTSTSLGFYPSEIYHAIAAQSIANAYALYGPLNPLTLSSMGAPFLGYHFLTINLASFFSSAFFVTLLESIYFITPAFLYCVLILSFELFFTTFPKLRVSYLFLFFLPVLISAPDFNSFLPHTFFSLNIQNIPRTHHFLGCVFLLFAFTFLAQKQYVLFVLCAVTLLFTKIPYFFILPGALILFSIRYFFSQSKLESLKYFSLAALLFFFQIVLFKPLLPDMNQMTNYLVFPFNIQFNFLRDSTQYIATLFIMLCLLVPIFFKKTNNNGVKWGLCFALSGVFGSLFITEIMVGDHYYFFLGSVPFILMSLNYFSKDALSKFQGVSKFIFSLCIATCIWASSYVFYRPVVQMLAMTPLSNYIQLNMGGLSKNASTLKQKHLFKKDIIDAYTAIETLTSKSAVIMYSPHYHYNNKSPKTELHLRSALSKRQFLLEYNWGWIELISTPPDLFNDRLLNTMHFFNSYVLKNDLSNRDFRHYLGSLRPLILVQTYPHLNSSAVQSIVSAHGIYDTFTLFPDILKTFIDPLLSVSTDQFELMPRELAITFLKKHGITHIVLEKNDRPTSFLKTNSKSIYKNQSIEVLELLF